MYKKIELSYIKNIPKIVETICVAPSKDLPPPQGKAYQLFLSELHKHLDLASKALLDFDNLKPDSARSLSIAFHTVKGSAGFFGLREIAAAAGKLEDIFEGSQFRIIELESEIHTLIGDIKKAYEDLSHPT